MTDQPSGFELQDHTADIALYVWGNTLEALFASAADGLYATIGVMQTTAEGRDHTLRLEAGDAESLLHDFLAELHFNFETRGVLFADFKFAKLDGRALEVTARRTEVDPEASIFDREVKAVTYHDLAITRHHGRYEVTLILDI